MAGKFDELCSTSNLAAQTKTGRLETALTDLHYKDILDTFLMHLACLIDNSAMIYQCESFVVCGELAAAASSAGFDLAAALTARLTAAIDSYHPPQIQVCLLLATFA